MGRNRSLDRTHGLPTKLGVSLLAGLPLSLVIFGPFADATVFALGAIVVWAVVKSH